MSQYTNLSITLEAGQLHSPGRATGVSGGRTLGHVAIYMDAGSVGIDSEDPAVLRSLAAALSNAADELDQKLRLAVA